MRVNEYDNGEDKEEKRKREKQVTYNKSIFFFVWARCYSVLSLFESDEEKRLLSVV